jgi:parallel beta-helix repeat protein
VSATICRRVIIAAAIAATFALPASASADTVNVHPGPNAVQDAINGASNGDTLRIHDGHYAESVNVTRKLILKGVGGRPAIDAGCDHDIALDVQHGGVIVRHLKVQGAAEGPGPGYTINLIGVNTGTVDDVAVKESCGGADTPEYGINIFDSGRLQITGNHTFGGFSDAGIYVGGINDTRGDSLLVKGNEADGNNRGIIIEDSFDSDVDIRVIDNDTHDNTRSGEGTPSGIFVHNSDHGTYTRNSADDNGDYGIHIDSPSDDNVFTDNDAQGNGTFDLFNEGTGNCSGGGNGFGTTSGNPLGPC